MNFTKELIRDFYLRDTHVENIFINEYLPAAPGDYIKVYLFALMYADFDSGISNETIAKQLGIVDEDILKAWSYWESIGVIKKHYEDPEDKFRYQVEFLNLKSRVYGKKAKSRRTEAKIPNRLKPILDDDSIKNMFSSIERITGRLFDGREPAEVMSWITDYNATPEMITYAYSYCKKKRNHSNTNYVAAIIKEWAGKGLKTVKEIEAYLEETDNRHYQYKRILRALGFMRNPTEEEKRIIDTWFDEMSFDIDRILEACKKTTGISNPNINYINTILKSWSTGKGKPTPAKKETGKPNQIGSVIKYYEEVREKNESLAQLRREEVYKKVPRIKEIETEAREMGLRISKLMLSGGSDAKSSIRVMKDKIDKLNQEKAFLMTENNFRIDYMDVVYDCSLCNDTGILDTGARCNCFDEKLKDLQPETER
jgi:DnaD/phage-associated family protein